MTTVNLTQTQMTLVGIAAIASILAVGLSVNLVFAQDSATTTITTTDTNNLLGSIGTTIAAVSTLVSTVIGIVVYLVAAVRSKTGDKIISKDAENKFLDIVAQVRQKDNELRDAYRQFLEHKETFNVALDIVKSTNPEVAKKINETMPAANKAIETKVLPQVAEWQSQADRFYDTLLRKSPIGS